MIRFPYQETFLITEINTYGKKLISNIQSEPVKSYLKEAAPLYKKLFRVSEKEFQQLIDERAKIIIGLLFKA